MGIGKEFPGCVRASQKRSWMIRTLFRHEDFKNIPQSVHCHHHTAFSDDGSGHEKGHPEQKKAEQFEFENWPQASRIGSWKISF